VGVGVGRGRGFCWTSKLESGVLQAQLYGITLKPRYLVRVRVGFGITLKPRYPRGEERAEAGRGGWRWAEVGWD
jgi:hypothetical protein